MKNDRKALNAIVAELSNNGAIPGTAKEILHKNIAAAYAKFVEFCKPGNRSEEEIKIAMKPVKDAIELYNDEMRCLRLESLEEMKPKDAMLDYIRTQCVSGFKMVKAKKTGAWEVVSDDKVELDANDFVATMCSAESDGIYDAACIFVDNVARVAFKDETASVTKNSMHPGYIEMRKRRNWDINPLNTSYGDLAKQMDEICKMISYGVAPRMQSTDVRFVEYGVIQSTSTADEAGGFQIRDERTAMKFIFRAMYTRYNKKPYAFQNHGNAEKAARSTAANAEMAESSQTVEFSPEKMPKAEDVILGKAAAKSTAPKATKKNASKKA